MLQHKINLLKQLRLQLQYGDNREIKKQTGFSEVYISQCLSPFNSAYNEIIVQEAIKLIEERNSRLTSQLVAAKKSSEQ